MPEHTDSTIGTRLRAARARRGLTQKELAGLAGVSVSLIRKLEQPGEDYDTRLETVRKLATALRMPTSKLIARDAGPDDEDTTDQWEPVRRALTAPLPDRVGEEPTIEGVTDALNAALPLFASDRFVELGSVLPPLLRDADALDESDPDARAVRVRLLQLTGWLLTQTRQYESAAEALDRSLDDATDRLQAAATVNTRCWLMLRQGQLAEARELATRWADEIEPRMSKATPDELSLWGWMLLRLSAAAVRDNRPGEAKDAMRLARSAAVALGREYAPHADFLRTFGPVTVALKRTENEALNDRPDQVIKLSAALPSSRVPTTSTNWNRHLLDVAAAYSTKRQYAEACHVLEGIYEKSPQWLLHQRYARDIVSGMIERRRILTPKMQHIADVIGVPL
ncbi:helix-turn-helix domain-containing protein [Streptomyces megasporus]|uniref:helix-turn-helix domain-containing protein n=1 Tax=Streptomyces megasporus TaxID=44060 RepID=UPI0004E1A7FD|nr:helix-turn-helix domain-containing protein [Streptomyces megasporus]